MDGRKEKERMGKDGMNFTIYEVMGDRKGKELNRFYVWEREGKEWVEWDRLYDRRSICRK